MPGFRGETGFDSMLAGAYVPPRLEFFVELVTKELDVARASIMLVDETGGALTIAASRGLTEVDVHSVRVPLGEGI